MFSAKELQDLEIGNAICYGIFADPDAELHGIRYKSGEINIFTYKDGEQRTVEEIIQTYSQSIVPNCMGQKMTIMALRTSNLKDTDVAVAGYKVVEVLNDELLSQRVKAEILGFNDGVFSEKAYDAYLGSYKVQGYGIKSNWRHFAAVCEASNEVVGSASIVFHGDCGFISAVAVVPESRRKGLATALTDYCLKIAKKMDRHTTEARTLYSKMGFVDAFATRTFQRFKTHDIIQ
ncbi:hypothetical protein BCR33DRAFT_722542 [Rhizoclosmatium globosum]|uniref:N-acetyltransferase domain-containing protein n=1 Tax=Rhizoclosmatium globosum TaxID=329046 RepID=A0A1Y2BK97_9FUNG|nr:hypothetical protein BCR33DRAFT_722542 [Rhizoclosmatium globosum]|eukprot:ORY35192.1 hypothetical protein BCR33DRAFT_722542 [Rhizoclosmatium globosum]